jgi:hypothetical protein
VATVVESRAPPPLVTAVAVEKGRTAVETTARPSGIGATSQGWLRWRGCGDGALGRRLGATPTSRGL